MELSKTAPDARSAAAFWRDNEQTACAAGRKREARVCESASKKAGDTQAESAKRGFASLQVRKQTTRRQEARSAGLQVGEIVESLKRGVLLSAGRLFTS